MRDRRFAAGRVAICITGLLVLTLGMYRLYELPRVGERPAQWALLAGLVICSGLLMALISPIANRLLMILVEPVRRYGLWAVAACALVAFSGFGLVAQYVLQGFPNSGDEYAFVLQAETYAQGRLWADVPPVVDAFRQYRFFELGDKWVSQYPPGWAAILAPAAALGLPLWVVTALLGAGTLFAFFRLACLEVSLQTAWAGVIILGTSAFFILNSASFFSHSLTAFCGILFALMGLRYLEKADFRCAVAAGVCLGLMGLTRSYNAVIFVVPFAVTLAMISGRRAGLVWLGLGGLPFLLALLAYNHQITGDPLTGVASLNGGEPFGFPASESLRLTVKRLRELIVWTSPILVFGYIVALWRVIAQRRANFTDWIMPLTLLCFLFYFGDGGNQYGPRYYFEAWPFAILTLAKAADPLLAGAHHSRLRWIPAAIVASLLLQLSVSPGRLGLEHRVVEERQAIYNEVERAGLKNAIVLISGKVGSIRPMPARDLLRNGLNVNDRDIVYAHDLGERNRELMALYPGRNIYIYSDIPQMNASSERQSSHSGSLRQSGIR